MVWGDVEFAWRDWEEPNISLRTTNVVEYIPKPCLHTDMLGRPITNINNIVALITLSSRL